VRVTVESGEVSVLVSEEVELSNDSCASCDLLPMSVPVVSPEVFVKPDPDCSREGASRPGEVQPSAAEGDLSTERVHRQTPDHL
jgi:hypothetical protein